MELYQESDPSFYDKRWHHARLLGFGAEEHFEAAGGWHRIEVAVRTAGESVAVELVAVELVAVGLVVDTVAVRAVAVLVAPMYQEMRLIFHSLSHLALVLYSLIHSMQ